MKLSIIIVNYNVQHFLEQCLTSITRATQGITSEVFVVDNNSSDGSLEMVRKEFSTVQIIANKKNLGFSKANNQAMEIAQGEYILLLNPDTVVEEDAFEKCISFMDKHPHAGGLGVKMIDGHGNFLPESKRGLPTPSTSFYKIFGLSKIFPRSKRFAKYHMGYLPENETNEIEILSGAFMWMRKSVLDEIGHLDEAFFMYGEDIDLSYRILESGYKNYYFPKTKIIHYKGESTKKGSINYILIFYKAMIIFSKKHFTNKAQSFSFFISIAIYLRALAAIIIRFIVRMKLPLIDAGMLFCGLVFLNYFKPYLGFPNQMVITNDYGILNVSSVIISIVTGLALSKSYAKTVSLNRTFIGLIIGSVLLYLINLSFPEHYSFSNKYLLSILSITFLLVPISRLLLNYFNKIRLKKKKSVITVGSTDFIDKLSSGNLNRKNTSRLLNLSHQNEMGDSKKGNYVGLFYQLIDLIEIYRVTEVIFSSKDISYKDIIQKMILSKNAPIDFKISLKDKYIIGANSVEKISKK